MSSAMKACTRKPSCICSFTSMKSSGASLAALHSPCWVGRDCYKRLPADMCHCSPLDLRRCLCCWLTNLPSLVLLNSGWCAVIIFTCCLPYTLNHIRQYHPSPSGLVAITSSVAMLFHLHCVSHCFHVQCVILLFLLVYLISNLLSFINWCNISGLEVSLVCTCILNHAVAPNDMCG